MTNLFDSGPEGPAPNLPEYSVSEISGAIRRTLENSFGYVRVRGEISGFKRHTSGHCYLTLKDEGAALSGVMWKGNAARLAFRPEDGLEVIVTGRVSAYVARSGYQIIIDSMEPAGAGALMALLEERRRKLAAEGLFEPAARKPIPFLPEIIGVVTSPTGAVIRDIMHRLNDRFPRRVLLWPVIVQGEGAAEQVAAAVAGFNRLGAGGRIPRPDVLIVARGGGSIEDLWAFNEEVVVRAVAASDIPVISAVGHETDTTLIDHAADKRCPTPTAAAETAVPVRADLITTVMDWDRRLLGATSRMLERRRQVLTGLARGLPRLRDMLGLPQQRFDDLSERLPRALRAGLAVHERQFAAVAAALKSRLLTGHMAGEERALADLAGRLQRCGRARVQEERLRFDGMVRLFDSLNYQSVLKRGYAVIRGADGKAVLSSGATRPGDALEIEFRDGRTAVTVDGAPVSRPRAGKPMGTPPTQGRLL